MEKLKLDTHHVDLTLKLIAQGISPEEYVEILERAPLETRQSYWSRTPEQKKRNIEAHRKAEQAVRSGNFIATDGIIDIICEACPVEFCPPRERIREKTVKT